MIRTLATVFISLTLILPFTAAATESIALLESAAQQDDNLQPGLEAYKVTVETAKIAETIAQMTANMPPDMPRPEPPTITKYWMRGAPKSLIVAEGATAAPYVAQMVERFSKTLAVDLDALLMPADRIAERQELLQQAIVKSSEVALADSLLQRIEITFNQPTDIDEAFYKTGIRLPQNQIVKLTFDVDVKHRTITEMSLVTADKLKLTVEIRYRELANDYLPERIQVTSPDGSVDDLFEVTFSTVGDYQLPSRMVRTIRRPNLQDDLDVAFTGYLINPELPAQIREQLITGQ